MLNGLRPDDVLIAVLGPPGMAAFNGCAARKIVFTTWEATRLPEDWIKPLAAADEVWTPTAWGADIMRRNGVDPARLHIIPEGVDERLFGVDGERLPLLQPIEGFKFLHVGKAEPRKGTVELLQAFDRAFSDDEPIYLILACHNRMIAGFDTVRFVENLGLRRRRWIVPIQPLPRREDVPRLFRSCDAFLAPSQAEGWGLPALEAMACGLPVALTHYSGHTAFADPDNSLAIPFHMSPIQQGELPHFARADGDYGQWAVPDIDALAEVMRTMRQDHERYRRRALSQAGSIADRWAWRRAAAKACDRIEILLRSPGAR
jgi:glycosyltransferase involved in cell wall biosynthesis